MGADRREARRIVKRLQRAEYGCTVTSTKSGHWKVTRPGCQPVYVSSTPTDHHAVRNILGDIRRHLGIEL